MKLTKLILLLCLVLLAISVFFIVCLKINLYGENFVSNIITELIGLILALILTYLIIENVERKKWIPIEKNIANKVRLFIESFYSTTLRILPAENETIQIDNKISKINPWEEAVNGLVEKVEKLMPQLNLERKKSLIENLEKLNSTMTDILKFNSIKPNPELLKSLLDIQEKITDIISSTEPLIMLEENPSIIPELKAKFFLEWNSELTLRYKITALNVKALDDYLYNEFGIRAWNELRNQKGN